MNRLSKEWGDLQEKLVQHRRTLDGKYLRLRNSGEAAHVAFIGNPKQRDQHWVNGRALTCPGKGCGFCEADEKLTVKVLLNTVDIDDGKLRIFEAPHNLFSDLFRLAQEHDLAEWSFSIRREGTGVINTRYILKPHRELTQAQKDKIAMADPYDLEMEVANGSSRMDPDDEALITEDPLD